MDLSFSRQSSYNTSRIDLNHTQSEQNHRYFCPVILALRIVYQQPVTVMVEQKEIEDLLGLK